ncbi:MAG: PilZ domain-containing protein [Desulfobacterales bacterium]|jgi:hypothetical protein
MPYENVVYLHDRAEKRFVNSRKYSRRPFRRATIFACQNRYYAGLTQNISKGGVFIETQNRFAKGQIITFVISRTKIKKVLMLKGQVIHRNRRGFGLKFLSLIKDSKEYQLK